MLEPRIRQILAAPGTDLNTISAKRVRRQLVELDSSITEEWVKENKGAIDEVIASVFEAVSGELVAQGPSIGKRERDDDGGYVNGSGNASSGQNGVAKHEDDDEPSTPPLKPKKQKTKRELTDEELARQLSSQINASSRSSRSGKATNGKSKKGASRTPKKNKKSAERVNSDGESDDDSDDGKKRKKKSGGGGGGGAKGGFGKEFMLR